MQLSSIARNTPVLQRAGDLPARILSEYSEMPGLRLTIPQASRLWNVDPQHCQQALESLTHQGFLYRVRDSYIRRDSSSV
jgi:hypothetical protein